MRTTIKRLTMAALAASAIALPAVIAQPEGGAGRRVDGARGWWAVLRYAGAAASARAAVAIALLSALWLALIAVVVATHESFWYVEGARAGLTWIARLGGLGAAALTAGAAASRAARATGWSAMLRETGAGRPRVAIALVAGDAGGALPAAVIAAWPTIWTALATTAAGGAARALVVVAAVVLGAVAAGAVARAARSIVAIGAAIGPAVGALVGVGLAAGVMW